MSSPVHPTVEFHDAVEFQDHTSVANVDRPGCSVTPDQHRRSGSPSPEDTYQSDSSLDSTDDVWVTAMIDAVSTSSSSGSDSDTQGGLII